jgi:tetratricopeptide (TPR) repeat protein
LGRGGDDVLPGAGADSLQSLGHALRELRRRHARRARDTPLTYRELAAKTGYAHGVIGDYLSGKVLPPTDRLDVLAVLLGASGEEQRAFAAARDRIEEQRRLAAAAARSAVTGSPQLRSGAPAAARGAGPPAERREPEVAGAQDRETAAEPRAAGSQAGPAAAATRTLPRDVVSFTGREPELRLLEGAVPPGGEAGIYVIGGMAGIGKTALAVHAAHRLAAAFPDGQVFLSLHGHTPGQRPVDPAEALAGVLLAAGIGASRIPAGLEPRTGMWRDYLAGKRLLLLLDDAAGSEQVLPLLPGTAGSLVLVTSRRHLTALEGARAVSLDTLAPGEAADLLIRLAGRPGLAAADPAVGDIARLCGCLPLAVGMLARQLHHHPAWTAASLAADLAAARDHRLTLMRTENASVAAAFDLSYQDLEPAQQRMFRYLGLHPGTDIEAYAAAALRATDLATARAQLEALYDQHLLTEPAHGRYRFHDLLREHARALAAADPAAARDAATGRLLDYYLHTAAAASQHVARRHPAVTVTPPAAVPVLTDRDAAITWLDAERLNLQAAAGHAAAAGRPGHAIAIPAAINGYLCSRGHWDEAITLHLTALGAARQACDQPGEATALTGLGIVQRLRGDTTAAIASFSRALDLYRDIGDRPGEAAAHNELGVARYVTGDPAAASSLTRALELYRDLGDRSGEAAALNDLSLVQIAAAAYPAAAASLSRALELHRSLSDQLWEANALNNMGVVQRLTGDYPAAAACHAQALGLYRDLGIVFGEAHALNNLGVVQRLTGDYPAAAACHAQALSLYRKLGNRAGEAAALNDLAVVHRLTGDHQAAAAGHNAALALSRDIGNRAAEADALRELGNAQCLAVEYQAAAASHARALELHRSLGSRAAEAEDLNSIGEAELAAGVPGETAAWHEQALAIAVAIASPLEEARSLEGIGRCRLRDSRLGEARESLLRALAIYQRIGSPSARRVAAALQHHAL